MLTRMRFKNWRSLRDVTIDNLTPITVFVGANSSGKTNILEPLHFYRFIERQSRQEAVYFWNKGGQLHTISAPDDEPIEFALSFSMPGYPLNSVNLQFVQGSELTPNASTSDTFTQPIEEVRNFARSRWQLLLEQTWAPFFLPSSVSPSELYLVDPFGLNVPLILDFMQTTYPDVFAELQADLSWLLGHVDRVETQREEQTMRVIVREKALGGQPAPTISGGTARVLAMLTAYYALDMRDPELPGLIAIEEPDTAIHPLLLGRLVELLRGYTKREGHPRQFILTTHNPLLLNFFEPEEVRIVERTAQGETTVSGIDMNLAKIALERDGAYNLGSIWTTRLLGGVPNE